MIEPELREGAMYNGPPPPVAPPPPRGNVTEGALWDTGGGRRMGGRLLGIAGVTTRLVEGNTGCTRGTAGATTPPGAAGCEGPDPLADPPLALAPAGAGALEAPGTGEAAPGEAAGRLVIGNESPTPATLGASACPLVGEFEPTGLWLRLPEGFCATPVSSGKVGTALWSSGVAFKPAGTAVLCA